MNIQALMNSRGLWVASSFMVISIVLFAVHYFRISRKRAKELGIPDKNVHSAIRSAAVTSLGPSLSPVIVLLSMITIIGAPTTWMSLNDVGAARTELAMITMASGLLGIDPNTAAFTGKAFGFSIWAIALNNAGWMIVALLLTHRMEKAVDHLYGKYDKVWINKLMLGATFGVTGYLLSNQIVTKMFVINPNTLAHLSGLVPALISGVTMYLMSRFVKSQALQELALGISMLVGMLGAQLVFG